MFFIRYTVGTCFVKYANFYNPYVHVTTIAAVLPAGMYILSGGLQAVWLVSDVGAVCLLLCLWLY